MVWVKCWVDRRLETLAPETLTGQARGSEREREGSDAGDGQRSTAARGDGDKAHVRGQLGNEENEQWQAGPATTATKAGRVLATQLEQVNSNSNEGREGRPEHHWQRLPDPKP